MPLPTRTPRTPRIVPILGIVIAASTSILACATPAEPTNTTTSTRTARSLVLPSASPPPQAPRTHGIRYHGTGWKALTSRGIVSINPDPYTIVFADSTARTKLTPYLTGPAAQITAATGISVTVSTTLDTTSVDACPPRHRIVVHYSYRPTGTAGMSTAVPCASTLDHSAWGGHLRINSEYWTPGWYSSDPAQQEIMRKNVISHELGHIFGLAHPNTDRDGDGTVENYECVKNANGWTPLMCSPNGGARTTAGAGKFVTEFDVAGLRQLARNWQLRKAAR